MTQLPELTAIELERCVSLAEAARIKGISADTFRRRYGHTIRRISVRRIGVKVRDLMELIGSDEMKGPPKKRKQHQE
jgi:hypothetical protein